MTDMLKDATVLVTGATGFIGAALIRHLYALNDISHANIQIVGVVRNQKKAQQVLGTRKDITYIEWDIREPLEKLSVSVDYIIHCAAVTQSTQMINHPVKTADTILLGTKNVLELAGRCHVKSMVYLSSMEIYGVVPDSGELTDETGLGTLDILDVRSCYPLGKRMAENYCLSYFKEYQVPVKIARLAQTFGSGIMDGDKRVYAQFAHAVQKGEDIVLHTAGNSVGNYCASEDTVSAIWFLLERGKDGEAYNVVNEALTMTICEMAELVSREVGCGVTKVVMDIPEGNPNGYAAETGLRLSGEKLRGLGWEAKVDMVSMYEWMLAAMQEQDRRGHRSLCKD